MSDLPPGSPEWEKRITASKVAAILGVSPWESPYSIWRKMRGDVPREESNDVQKRGHYLEPAILAWWRDRHGMDDDPLHWREQPVFTLGDWAAATPDAMAEDVNNPRCLVEAKSAAYDDDWGDPGTDAIPAYYLVQVQWQMHVSGIHRCYVPVLTSRLRFVEYVVDYYPEHGAHLEALMREFYDSLAADEPPPLDDTVATFEVVRKLHPDVDDKAAVEIPADVAAELVYATTGLAEHEKRDRLARATVIDLMGRANYATCNGVRIARRQRNKTGVSFVPVAKTTDFLQENAS